MDGLVSEIAEAAREQSTGIGQINTAVSQIDGQTQQTASASEETASTAEVLSSHAAALRERITQLRELAGGTGKSSPQSMPDEPSGPALAARQDSPSMAGL